MLEDPKPEIQSTAIRLLAGTSGLEERFRRFLESPNEFVVDAAARALAQVGDKAALPVFRKRISSSRFHEFLPDFLAMAEPTWSTLLHGALFKIPDKGGTVADVVEGIRLAMKEKGCEVRFELGEEVLKNNIGFHYGISPNGWGLGWVRTMIPGSDYFFDGKVLFILPRAEAQKRWLEWAKTK